MHTFPLQFQTVNSEKNFKNDTKHIQYFNKQTNKQNSILTQKLRTANIWMWTYATFGTSTRIKSDWNRLSNPNVLPSRHSEYSSSFVCYSIIRIVLHDCKSVLTVLQLLNIAQIKLLLWAEMTYWINNLNIIENNTSVT